MQSNFKSIQTEWRDETSKIVVKKKKNLANKKRNENQKGTPH